MVTWTKRAECKKSGLAEGCTLSGTTENNMRGLIDLAIAETNSAFNLSGVTTQLRLVHAYREPNYHEDVTNAFGSALSSIRGKTDGVLDDVHTLRNTYGADIVAMIIDDQEHCGMAYAGPQSDLMFSVTAWNCATGYYSFGHAIGRNMVSFTRCEGRYSISNLVKAISNDHSFICSFYHHILIIQGCNKDKGSIDACSSKDKFNYGWRDPNAEFRSILASDCDTKQCDNMPKNECTRVQRFSNENHLYNGIAMGSPEHNNAKHMNQVKKEVAAYQKVKIQPLATTKASYFIINS